MSWTDFIKIPWNKYEAALLVDAYLKYTEGQESKSEIVSSLSRRLRRSLQVLGIPISSTYRNETGISLQMSAIEFLFTDGERGISHTSSLFKDIVTLYNEDRSAFDTILAIAVIKYPPLNQEEDSSNHLSIYSSASSPEISSSCNQKYISKKIYDILIKKFPKGFRLNSYMEVTRLRDFYKTEYSEELDMDMDDICEDVKACGIEHEGRVYIPERMLSSDVKEHLMSYISDVFDSGRHFIFYSTLFDLFQEEFLDEQILNADMLKAYLEYINQYGWVFYREFFSLDRNVVINIIQDVSLFVKGQGGVVTEDEVVSALSYYPEKDVRLAFDERDTDLISCGRNQRFHIDNFVISAEELGLIEGTIRKAIEAFRYISFSELLKDIGTVSPSVINNNQVFGTIGLRNVLAVKLASKFNFNNNIISDFTNPIKAEDTFIELAKRDRFTLDDINSLATDCGTIANAYIEVILKTAVRVEKELYVSKNQVCFCIDNIDAALLKFCNKDYIAFPDITTLSALPDCGFQWNPFLLESYIAFHSKVFKLVHSRYFGQKNVTGGIVKRSSSINDFVTLTAHAVADSDIPINKKDVLEFLFDKWYIAQRRTESIDDILAMASTLRDTKKQV